ncbi:unnamed protein product [Hermetia illucens]|uniref:Diphthine--ammonia ligase n=1 Tax=Hermetia illucens TaxID=343691 RepID=A0A7R8UV38_HERIL|nr:diphthine--ammonia ligase [Hermetia illucens]CAD7087670.1 unnamed protein product [Hermetia illucens]
MRVVAMVSGGKDSCYNMMQCVAEGHEIVALANLHPRDRDELDSYMYQTVGHMGIEILAKAMGLPLFRRETRGLSTQTGKQYVPTHDDEVEDLYSLLEWTKRDLQVEAVAVGAILSDYQRVRVENVCSRLNLVPLAYLWRRDQTELLQEMIDSQVHAIIIKVAALGLVPDRHLGKSLREMQPYLLQMHDKYGLNVCGEGGEYETFTLDCPLFKQRILIEDMQTIISSADPICPVGYINFTKLSLQPKDSSHCNVIVKTSLDYISDLNESNFNDLSDPDLSETELEIIEKETRLRESISHNDLISRSNSFGRQASSPIPIVTKSSSIDETSSAGPPLQLATSAPQTQPPSPIKYEREFRPIDNCPMAAVNRKGWMWVAGIQGCGEDIQSGMMDALDKLKCTAEQNNYELSDFCYITMYMRNILEYPLANELYAQVFNFYNPPTRVCVECPLPDNCHIVMEAVGYKSNCDASESSLKFTTMHVQGISHWAPANIGPYSQSTKIGEITYISGQIALVPGSMTLVEGGIRPQCKLALRHISRIAKAMNANGQLRDVVQGICFTTHPNYIAEARRQWERCTTNAIIDYIVVPALPREALVEWQVWAHSHNDRFDYEETGCSVSEYTISIRRRWNYENNCAAIVCYVSTGLASSTTQLSQLSDDTLHHHKQLAQNITAENINEVLSYVLGKLLKDYPRKSYDRQQSVDSTYSDNANKSPSTTLPQLPAIHLKLFYQVSCTPSVQLLLNTLQDFKMKTSPVANIVYTVLPACSLHNFSTFLSICGIRHE